MMGLNRSFSDANFAEDIDKADTVCLDYDEPDLNFISNKLGHNEEPLLDGSSSHVYDQYKHLYAELLYRCDLPEKAIEITHLMNNKSSMDIESFVMSKAPKNYDCPKCHERGFLNSSINGVCTQCRARQNPRCVYCRLPVRGHVSACLACGHGGHLSHMMQWFDSNNHCATSCGCNRLEEMENLDYTQIWLGNSFAREQQISE